MTNYVTKRILHRAIEDLENLGQATCQNIGDYYKELQKRSKHLGEAFDNSALLQIFQRGLLPTIRSLAEQAIDKFTEPTAVMELRDFLSSAQETHRGLVRSARATSRGRDGVLIADTEGPSRTLRRNSSPGTRDFFGNSRHANEVNLIGDIDSEASSENGTGLPGGRNYESTFNSLIQVDGELDEIQAIDIRPPQERRQPSIRDGPGQGDRPHSEQIGTRGQGQRSSQFLLPLICHLRFEEGHIKPNCRYLNVVTKPQYLKYFQ